MGLGFRGAGDTPSKGDEPTPHGIVPNNSNDYLRSFPGRFLTRSIKFSIKPDKFHARPNET